MSGSYTVFAWNAAGFVFLAAICLMLIPRLWKPEMPFGVSVPAGEGREKVKEALSYWTKSVLAITAVALGAAFYLSYSAGPERTPRLAGIWQLLYATALYASYGRARRIVLPLSTPPSTVCAPLRRRRYGDYISPWWEVIPLSLTVAAVLVAVLGKPSAPMARNMMILVVFMMPTLYLVNVAFALLIVRSKQVAGGGNPEVALAASDALRRAWLRWIFVARSLMAVGHVLLAAAMVSGYLTNAGPPRPVLYMWFILILAIPAIGGTIIQILYGQGGWRWAVRKGLVAADEVGPMMNGDGMQDRHWKLGMFYYNREDPSLLVERRFGVGWTLNFGNTVAIALMAAFVCLFMLPIIVRIVQKLWKLWPGS